MFYGPFGQRNMKIQNYTDNEFVKFLQSDDALFHYTKKSIALEKILYFKLLKFGSLDLTNDPQEYTRKFIPPAGFGLTNKSITRILETERLINRIITEEIGFISFCQNRRNYDYDEDGCLKSRMWSQYGENHEGVCFVFSKTKLLETIKAELKNSKLFYKDIVYSDELSESLVLLINEDECCNLSRRKIAEKSIFENINRLFFYKQVDYKDENEFRIVMYRKGSRKELLINIENSLKGIILGDNFCEVYYPSILHLIQNMNICVKKLFWEMNRFFLIDIEEQQT